MAEQRSTIEFTVDGLSIAALTAGPAADPATGPGKPLIAALHGGTYTARYFEVAGSPQGTFMDLAAAAGYPVVCFDRPGYGGSPALAPAENTFGRRTRAARRRGAHPAGQATRVPLPGARAWHQDRRLTGHRPRWSAPTSTSHGPATASPMTA